METGGSDGPGTNVFSGSTEAIAVAARDVYFTANATVLAEHDADADLQIHLVVDGTTLRYERRVDGEWVIAFPPNLSASGLAVSGDGLFVVDSATDSIHKYNFDGERVSVIYVLASSNPSGIALDGQIVYVRDTSGNTMLVYDAVSGQRDTAPEFALESALMGYGGLFCGVGAFIFPAMIRSTPTSRTGHA